MTFEQALTAMKEGKKITTDEFSRGYISLAKGNLICEELDIDSPEYTEDGIQDMIDGAIECHNEVPLKYFDKTAKVANIMPTLALHDLTENTIHHYSVNIDDLLREDWQIVE